MSDDGFMTLMHHFMLESASLASSSCNSSSKSSQQFILILDHIIKNINVACMREDAGKAASSFTEKLIKIQSQMPCRRKL
jgi:hypothetical protein